MDQESRDTAIGLSARGEPREPGALSFAPKTSVGQRAPIRVLFMQSQAFFGADSVIHASLMRHLDRRKVEVHVACNPGSGSQLAPAYTAISQIPGISIRRTHFGPTLRERTPGEVALELARYGSLSAWSMAGLVAYARRHRIDVVHCTEKPRDAFYGFLLSRAIGARCLIHLHVKAENWISPLVRWAMRHADLVLGVSQFVKESIIALGYPESRAAYVLNGLELDSWTKPSDGARIRAEFGISGQQPLLAIVARLFAWKGHAELLRALALAKNEVPDFRLLIVGEDDPRANPGNKRFSEELRSLVQKLGLTDHVTFTGFRSDVPDIMAACDIYAMPSFEEPFGMVYLEAMALEKPVVALDNGGAREIVVPGVTGLLSAPKDLESLAQNLVRMMREPDLRRRMGAAGKALLLDRFGASRMARDMEAVYASLVFDSIAATPEIAIAGG